ncbi:hypothetical protein SBI_06622 [Streptomyces bingchenggensis BCW-1]|uniref:Uncharacterized protein n=1 Tax=Streptomyces bingchenggensis (strain BCW-1) TaxID=749414 RepID=D7BW13_STRBB|nr:MULTISPECIES: hypothetical protein [Streptomyces]ADI09742.1 hypothetical protein SBI_06622 [Streptomyces bingchenggensis BCW-1]
MNGTTTRTGAGARFLNYVLLGCLLLILALQAPGVTLGVLAALGALLVWTAAQPVVWAFLLGLAAHRLRRWHP